jgi:hypothetical protein
MGELNTAAVILGAVDMINTYGPQIVALVMEIQHPDGTRETVDVLEHAKSKFQDSVDKAEEALGLNKEDGE